MQGQHLQPGKCMGFVFALAGDGEWFQNEYKLPGFAFNDCCFNCKANKSDISFNDFRANATWRTTIIKHEGTCPTEHPVASIPGVAGEPLLMTLSTFWKRELQHMPLGMCSLILW